MKTTPLATIREKFIHHHWKEFCKVCNKEHTFHQSPCPSCGVYLTAQPITEKCPVKYECDGCEAYRDHER